MSSTEESQHNGDLVIALEETHTAHITDLRRHNRFLARVIIALVALLAGFVIALVRAADGAIVVLPSARPAPRSTAAKVAAYPFRGLVTAEIKTGLLCETLPGGSDAVRQVNPFQTEPAFPFDLRVSPSPECRVGVPAPFRQGLKNLKAALTPSPEIF